MKAIKNIGILFLLALVVVHAGCKKDPVMYAKGFETFKFIVKNDQGIAQEYAGTIAGEEILVQLPAEVDVTTLKATFVMDNPRTIVQVGNEVQENGVSDQDFTQPVVYRIKAEDKSSRSYTVRVEKKIALRAFGFFKEDNPGVLEADYQGMIRGLKIDLNVPETIDLTKLVARFETTAGVVLKVNEIQQESKKTVNNFSTELNYTFTESNLAAPLTFKTNLSFIGAQWFLIGDQSIIAPKAASLKMAIDPVSKYPYLVYQRTGIDESGKAIETDNRKVAVLRYNGTEWKSVGATTGVSEMRADLASISFDEVGTPYIAYRDYVNSDNKPTVLKYIDDQWTTVGVKRFTPVKVDKLSFTIGERDQPVVAVSSSSTDVVAYPRRSLYVSSFNGSLWINASPAGSLLIAFTQVFKGLDGKTYMAVLDRNQKANLFRLENGTWKTVGPASFGTSDGLPAYTSINGAVDAKGNAYIAYQTVVSSQRNNRVLRFNGSTWEEMGNAGTSQSETDKYTMAIHPDGTLFFAYANSSGLNFRTFNTKTNNWNTPRQIISGRVNEFDMQISADGIPYIAASLISNDKTVVYKYALTK